MAAQQFRTGRFLEGVRAGLIDKDNSPRWQPSSIDEVTEAMIEDFFRERWSAETHPLDDLESFGAAPLLGTPRA